MEGQQAGGTWSGSLSQFRQEHWVARSCASDSTMDACRHGRQVGNEGNGMRRFGTLVAAALMFFATGLSHAADEPKDAPSRPEAAASAPTPAGSPEVAASAARPQAASSAGPSATPVAVPSGWDGIKVSIQRGCVSNQLKFSSFQSVKQEVMVDACGCLATETTDRMRDSPEFRKAMIDGDRDAMPALMQKLQTEKDGTSLFASCTDRAIAKQGGLAAATKTGDALPTFKGLKGYKRTSFIEESSKGCTLAFTSHVSEGKIKEEQLNGFCGCMAEGVADRISEADLADGLKSQGRTPAMDGASMEVQRTCSARFVQ